MHQGKPIGILYLENNLITEAFTRDRIEVVQILTSQAAIALDLKIFAARAGVELDRKRTQEALMKARAELEIRVKERTIELTEANEQLEQLTADSKRSNQDLEQFAYIASHYR